MELVQVDIGIYHLKMHFKLVLVLCSKSKTSMKEYFRADYFLALNRKDHVVLKSHRSNMKVCYLRMCHFVLISFSDDIFYVLCKF